jgi:hypothetical protein
MRNEKTAHKGSMSGGGFGGKSKRTGLILNGF